MPAFERAQITAEFRVIPPGDGPGGETEAAREAAGGSGLAREAGPETVVLAGEREEVLLALTKTVEAALDAGARGVEIKVEAEAEADRFDRT